MKLVLDILSQARALMLDIQPIWVSRDNPFLLKADAISKGIDSDNWESVQTDCANLEACFGPFLIDLFAVGENAQCEQFYTRSWEKGSAGVDAFSQSWSGEKAYTDPPVSLVMRTIRKMAITVMKGVLIIPLWKNAKFWTFAFLDGIHLNAMFDLVQIVRMHTRAWKFSKKDIIGGKEIQFLVFDLGNVRGEQSLELLLGTGRCFQHLFSRDCKVC
jgi:hypothetical protein